MFFTNFKFSDFLLKINKYFLKLLFFFISFPLSRYGLHLGWGIEGAIGSSHKVDASYLSPHVNLSSRLEAASKQFHVQLLLSDSFVQHLYSKYFIHFFFISLFHIVYICTDFILRIIFYIFISLYVQGTQLKKECRPLDVVTVKGSLKPITLYTHQPSEYPIGML